jgi:hypothetical protein
MEPLANSIELIISIINQFGLAATDATRVANVLAAAAALSATSVVQMRESMKYAGPVAAALQMTVEATAAAIGALAKQGIVASQAGTELRIVLTDLARGSDKARKLMGLAGVDVDALEKSVTAIERMGFKMEDFVEQYEALESMGPMDKQRIERLKAMGIDVEKVVKTMKALKEEGVDPKGIVELRKQMRGMGMDMEAINPARVPLVQAIERLEQLRKKMGEKEFTALIMKAFSVRAASGILAFMRTGSKGLRELEKGITGTNAAFQMAEDQMKTLQGQWSSLLTMWEKAQFAISKGLYPALMEGVQVLKRLVDFGMKAGVFQRFGEVVGKALSMVAEAAEPIGKALITSWDQVLKIMPAFLDQLGAGLAELMPTVLGFIERLPELANTVLTTLVPAFMKLATTAGPLLVQWVETVLPLLSQLGATLMDVVVQALTYVNEAMGRTGGQQIVAWFQGLLESAIALAQELPTLLPLLSGMAEVFIKWVPSLAQTAIELLPALVEALRGLPEDLGKFIDIYMERLKKFVTEITPALDKLVNETIPKLLDALVKISPELDKLLAALGKALTMLMQITASVAGMFGMGGPEGLKKFREWVDGMVEQLPKLIGNLARLGAVIVMIEGFRLAKDLAKTIIGIPMALQVISMAYKAYNMLLDAGYAAEHPYVAPPPGTSPTGPAAKEAWIKSVEGSTAVRAEIKKRVAEKGALAPWSEQDKAMAEEAAWQAHLQAISSQGTPVQGGGRRVGGPGGYRRPGGVGGPSGSDRVELPVGSAWPHRSKAGLRNVLSGLIGPIPGAAQMQMMTDYLAKENEQKEARRAQRKADREEWKRREDARTDGRWPNTPEGRVFEGNKAFRASRMQPSLTAAGRQAARFSALQGDVESAMRWGEFPGQRGPYPGSTRYGSIPGGGAAGPEGAYVVGPFYVNSLEAMRGVFDEQYRAMEASEQRRKAIRGSRGAR